MRETFKILHFLSIARNLLVIINILVGLKNSNIFTFTSNHISYELYRRFSRIYFFISYINSLNVILLAFSFELALMKIITAAKTDRSTGLVVISAEKLSSQVGRF